MNAVENDEDYYLTFPTDYEGEIPSDLLYNELVEIDSICFKRIKAKDLWNKLVHCAWNTAEPGVLFQDTIHNYSPDGGYPQFRMISTNPCGEITLGPYDSCRLIHLNLTSFIIEPFTSNARFDYALFEDIVSKAIRLADDIVDLELEQVNKILAKLIQDKDEDEIKLWTKFKDIGYRGRRAGLGFTGLADAIAMLNLTFGSDESLEEITKIMKSKFYSELRTEIELAKERGTFPDYNINNEWNNKWFNFIKMEFPELAAEMSKYGRRNLSWSTVN